MNEFEKIIGYESIKFELERICDVLKNFDKYQKVGVKQPTGILLHGDAGLGKTLMANCFAKQSGWNVFVCRKDKPNGDFVNEIKNTYEQAESKQPAIVFLDDLDKFSNEDEKHRNSEEFITVQSSIDKAKDKRIFTLATANSINEFPESLLRAGRFDTVIKVDNPKGEDCKKIIEHYLSQKKHIANLDIDEISKILDGSSCAELELVINEAGIYAVANGKQEIDTDDIIKACMRIIFKAPETVYIKDPICIEMTAYHEAGHAVVNEILEPGSVNLLSVCKYEGDIGGITSLTQREDYFLRKAPMENRVISLLGGKAATELIFGEVDVGATNDTKRAFRIVDRFVDDYCSFGFDCFDDSFLDTPETLASKIQNKNADEMTKYYLQAKQILAQNINFLHALAKQLVIKKTLRAKDIKQIKQSLNIC